MRSMTGYGSGKTSYSVTGIETEIRVEVRTVNHRHLDVRVRLDDELAALAPLAPLIEAVVRKRLGRGRVDVAVTIEGSLLTEPALDRRRARTAYEELCALRDEIAPNDVVPLSLLAAVPDLFRPPRLAHADEVGEYLRSATLLACDAVEQMRGHEGRALAEDLGANLDLLSEHCALIREVSGGLVTASRERLRKRLERLLLESQASLDSDRLEQEVALLADKTDVAEELSRLDAHSQQFRDIMADNTPVGRKLDFLLQEMAREANTIGSKIQDAAVTPQVVELKTAIERLREQVQNVL